MRNSRSYSIVTAVLLVAAAAAGVSAQGVISRVQQPRAYLGFSYEAVDAGIRGDSRPAIVVIEVVGDSPAERAGLAVDDMILSINDIRVTEEFISSLSTSLAPGDRVRLRIRRDGREREITVEAARRPSGYGFATPRANTWSFEVSPDTLRGRMRVFLDSALNALDTMRFPSFRVETTPGGGVWMFTDSSRLQLVPDSLWTRGGRALLLPRDSAFLWRGDSTWARTWPGVSAYRYSLHGDSLFGRLHADTTVFRAFPRDFRFSIDSMPILRFRGDLEGGRIFGLRGDSVFTYQAMPGGVGISSFAMRAIGGAELTDLNEGLAEYFGADEGVLVVRVPDRTPAARAGLEAGDVIVRTNGVAVRSISELRRTIGRSDEPIRLEIIRRNARRTIELRE
ncbi:MAG TPA: PDZ domain-containing protein [Longimicrobiales bacterium]|nr:PDZ domain-containing protein [Longimicrobiales bacterium]